MFGGSQYSPAYNATDKTSTAGNSSRSQAELATCAVSNGADMHLQSAGLVEMLFKQICFIGARVDLSFLLYCALPWFASPVRHSAPPLPISQIRSSTNHTMRGDTRSQGFRKSC